MTCEHCGRQVPQGAFCANCGAHHGVGVTDAKARPRHFAAHPSEHVAQPSVFTTLFPQVGHDKVHEFRYAFLAGLAIVLILVATGLVLGALLAAIFLVPVLYFIYMYEAQVYRHEPALILGVTVLGGIVLGLIVTIIAERIIGSGTAGHVDTTLIGYAVVLPIIQVIVIPLPALVLRRRPGFAETIDGLTFGVAAGLGFSVAEGIVRFSTAFANLGAHTTTNSASWVFPLVSVAVLIPLLHGSTGGAIAAGVWRPGRQGVAKSVAGLAIPVVLVVCIAFYLVAQVMADNGASPLIVLLYQALPVGVLLIYVRYLLHHALIEEAADLGFRSLVCPQCRRHVMAAGFCPSCGVALSATPRSAAPAGASAQQVA